MIDIQRFIASDDYETVGYFTKSHVERNEFLEAAIKAWEDENDSDEFVCLFIASDIKYEYWKVMNEEEKEEEGEGDDDLEHYSLSDKSDPRSFPVTAIFSDESYKVR
jgi:hypothetical protein